MRIRMRPYAGEADQQRMSDLVHAAPAGNIHLADLPYRLSSWAFDDPGNIGLWEDGTGHLLAWAVLQTPFWAIDYAYRPDVGDYGIHPMILTWAVAHAAAVVGTANGRPAWYVSVFADQADRQGDLERAGFVRQADWSQVLMERPAAELVPPAILPDGFTVRPLAGPAEAAAYTELHRAAFRSENMTAAWRARTLARREYIADLDLVVVAPDGRLAAFCVGWLDRHGPGSTVLGQVEPLGVHPDFQGQGLGRAVLLEAMRRMQAHGATRLVVETDTYRDTAFGLYQSVGFGVAHDIWVYGRAFTAAA
ncbi:MAG TPA: GNAT family N-acetyltransferase [Chloroflexia bacterium]